MGKRTTIRETSVLFSLTIRSGRASVNEPRQQQTFPPECPYQRHRDRIANVFNKLRMRLVIICMVSLSAHLTVMATAAHDVPADLNRSRKGDLFSAELRAKMDRQVEEYQAQLKQLGEKVVTPKSIKLLTSILQNLVAQRQMTELQRQLNNPSASADKKEATRQRLLSMIRDAEAGNVTVDRNEL